MLRDGLYEQIINKGLDNELSENKKFSQIAPIDTAEAPKVLAKYVAEVVERGLENLKDNGGDINDQVTLTNQVNANEESSRSCSMKGWTNDDRVMIVCCNDGTRPVIFKIERIDIPETEEEREWLRRQNFRNSAEDAYTG